MLSLFKRKKVDEDPNKLSGNIVKAYNKTRNVKDKSVICHAPFKNMYFNSVGDVAMCWSSFHNPDRYNEDTNTIRDIWWGENFTKTRESIKNLDLDFKCKVCKKHFQEGNYVNVLAKAYDTESPIKEYPTIMEFELTNTCNLECQMCTELLSSSIRAAKGLPELVSPYGDKFVEELTEFIPHLEEARFNGGEPFIIKHYWDIWDKILEIKPDLRMTIATNGTVMNGRVQEYLKRGNFHLNISIDGFSAESYEKIRKNGRFERVMTNFKWFRDYCKTNNRNLCVMVNPMRNNWWEMGEFINFVNENDVHIWYNTIVRPEEWALWNLPSNELEEIYKTLSDFAKNKIKPITPNTRPGIYDYNVRTFNNLVHQQIKTWLDESYERKETFQEEEKVTLTSIEDLKWAFLNKLHKHMEDTKLDMTKGDIEWKIYQLENELNTEERKKFYSILNSSPVEVTVESVTTKETDELLKMLRLALDQYNAANH